MRAARQNRKRSAKTFDYVSVTVHQTPSNEVTSLRSAYILIATGSAPFRPPAFPFEMHGVYDSDTILELDRIPETLAVAGAGVIGSEYASTFAALGARPSHREQEHAATFSRFGDLAHSGDCDGAHRCPVSVEQTRTGLHQSRGWQAYARVCLRRINSLSTPSSLPPEEKAILRSSISQRQPSRRAIAD